MIFPQSIQIVYIHKVLDSLDMDCVPAEVTIDITNNISKVELSSNKDASDLCQEVLQLNIFSSNILWISWEVSVYNQVFLRVYFKYKRL